MRGEVIDIVPIIVPGCYFCLDHLFRHLLVAEERKVRYCYLLTALDNGLTLAEN